MMSLSIALVLLAAATMLWSRPDAARTRLASMLGSTPPAPRAERRPGLLLVILAGSVGVLFGVVGGWPQGLAIGAVAAGAAWWCGRRLLRGGGHRAGRATDQLGLAAGWDLLAACLRAGLPVPTGVRAVADGLPAAARDPLRATAELLALGADPIDAWAPALACEATAGLARGARRTARSGTALAGVASALAADVRAAAGDAAEAKAQRAGVLITGPLGLCFLPAFVCLGIVPVVVGLASHLSVHP